MENQKRACPCCSGKLYAECCEPFHAGLLPENALKLMRSRYSAYALNIPAYIIQTTHPKNPLYCEDRALWAKKISDFSSHTQFEKLEVLDFQESGAAATVTFVAHLSQNHKDATFTEKSHFEKVDGKWLYRSAEFTKG